jgi:inhibitor of cysteine peptidase
MHFNTDRESLQNGNHRTSYAIHTVVVALTFLLVVAGCAAKHAATSTPPKAKPPIVVSESDADKPIQLILGQTLQVRLASNPTTGYSWSVQQRPDQLELVQSAYAADPQGRNMPGAGGHQTIEFVARSAGNGELKLEYRRPWEKNVAPARTFTASVVVK